MYYETVSSIDDGTSFSFLFYLKEQFFHVYVIFIHRKQEESYAASKLVDVDANGDQMVSWSEYLNRIYGYTVEEMALFENDSRPEMKTFTAVS